MVAKVALSGILMGSYQIFCIFFYKIEQMYITLDSSFHLFLYFLLHCVAPSSVCSGDENGRGQEYVYRNDWGEQMTGKHQVRILVIYVSNG